MTLETQRSLAFGFCRALIAVPLGLFVAPPAPASEVLEGTGGPDNIDVSTSTQPHEIYAYGGYDFVSGTTADDYIEGGSGNDVLLGNDGMDTLIGGTQPDTIDGGSGDDVIIVSGTRDGCDSVSGGPGFDTLRGSGGDDTICVAEIDSIEQIDAGLGQDTLRMANGGAAMLDLSRTAMLGVELVVGSRSNDVIIGSSGPDTIAGDLGNDVIDGGAGQDTARFAGPLAHYSIVIAAPGLAVTDLIGKEKTDTLVNVELLQFADQTVAASDYLPANPDNGAPSATLDSATVNEDSSVEIDVLSNDSDPDGDQIYVAGFGGASHGTVSVTASANIRYVPEHNFYGFDEFSYEIEDGRGGHSSAAVVIEVLAVADAPKAADDLATTETNQPVLVNLLENDTDADGDEIRISRVNDPEHGLVEIVSATNIRYRPAQDFSGTDTFGYEIVDTTGRTGSATLSVRVTSSAPPSDGSALIDVVRAAPEGSWVRVNKNRFSSVWPDGTQIPYTPGYLKPAKVIFAWGSMAWDPNRDHLIFWGGGHANYSGNEVYRFDTTTLLWERASLPSDMIDLLGDKQYFAVDGPNNAPTSAHTYDNQIFLPLADRFLTFGGAKFNGKQKFVLEDGVTLTGPYFWDPSRAGSDMVGGTTGSHVNPAAYPGVIGGRMWENRDTVVRRGQGSTRPSGDFVNSTTAYQQVGGKDTVFVTDAPRRGGELFRYTVTEPNNASLDRWEIIGEDGIGYGNQGAGAYDPGRQLYVRTANTFAGYALVAWDTSNPGPHNKSFLVVPNDPSGKFRLTDLHGMDFDLKRRAFVLWDGGPDVWYVTPPEFGWSGTWAVTHAPTGDPRLGPQQNDASLVTYNGRLKSQRGVLGKWEYAPDLDLFFGVVAPEAGDVWVYKPVGWTEPK